MFFARVSNRNVQARMPASTPPNFKGVTVNGEKLAEVIKKNGNVPFNPFGAGLGALRLDLPAKLFGALRGFLQFSSFEGTDKPNKFTLRGAANFTGDYPPELLAERKDVKRR